MITANGTPTSMKFQCTRVKKPLGAVKRICSAGNRVVFDDEGSYILNKNTGETMPLREDGDGQYLLGVFIVKPNDARSSSAGFAGQGLNQ